MNLTCADIAKYIEGFANKDIALEWDNVGLMLGSFKKKISTVMACIDVTTEVVDEAIKNKVDLIVSHHPLFFKSLKRLISDEAKGRIVYKLIKNDIAVYSAHTNLDITAGGINDLLAEIIGLTESENLVNVKGEKLKEAVGGNVYGLGRTGELKDELDIEEFVDLVKTKLNVKNLRLIACDDKKIKRVAVFCGGFDENLIQTIKGGVDILVTGDIRYHTALILKEEGISTIDAGHFSTEFIMVPKLIEMISKKFPELKIISNRIEEDPFIFY